MHKRETRFMFQALKLIYKVFIFIIKIWWGKTFMHVYVSGLPPPYFDNKTNVFACFIPSIYFYYQNMVGEDLKHA